MCGPYVSKKDGRLVCTIYNKITKRVTTTTYPRYVYQKHYNKIIPKGVEVHHIDENFLNNDIDNLELIEKAKHIRMHFKGVSKHPISKIVNCYFCKKEFTLTRKQIMRRVNSDNLNKKGPFCSLSCSSKNARYSQMERLK